MSRDLLRLFLAQNSIWQNGTTFLYLVKVAVIVTVLGLVGTSFLWPGFQVNLSEREKFENRLIRGLGTRTRCRLFTLSIQHTPGTDILSLI